MHHQPCFDGIHADAQDVPVVEMVFNNEGESVRARSVHSPDHMPHGSYDCGFSVVQALEESVWYFPLGNL